MPAASNTATRHFLAETRATLDGNTLRGHAAVFGQMAELFGGYERIAPGAFDNVLQDSDARALVNHNPNELLGRQGSGTLRLRTDDVGLAFEVDLPDTGTARDLRELVRRGDLSGASFAFIPGDVAFERAPDGRQVLVHNRVEELLDVSAVTYPAYDGTEVALRAIEFNYSVTDHRSALLRARAHARGIRA